MTAIRPIQADAPAGLPTLPPGARLAGVFATGSSPIGLRLVGAPDASSKFGTRPAGGKPLNRVALPPQAGKDFPRLGRPPLGWAELDSGGRISRARLRPAAVRNWRGFDDACRRRTCSPISRSSRPASG
jgi:hypothetical protein